MEKIVLGGGCFWCLDASFRLIKGVTNVISGYAGGITEDPTYEEVCTGTTNHVEVVEVTFDSSIITLGEILDIFFTIHDPTTLNRQGADSGTQYRSVIYYLSEKQRATVEHTVELVQKLWDNKIVTEVAPLEKFYPAEDYHQDYFNKNQSAGYCQAVINPKLSKLRQEFDSHIR